MRELLIILAIVTSLAYLSQRQSMKITNGDGRKHWDIYLIILLVFLILFAGLRTSYNDTGNYIVGFNTSVGIREFLSHSENLQPLNNPLFYGFQALIRSFTDNEDYIHRRRGGNAKLRGAEKSAPRREAEAGG